MTIAVTNVMTPQLTLENMVSVAPVDKLEYALPREVHLKISKEFLNEIFSGKNAERHGILHVFDVLYGDIKRQYKYKYGLDAVLVGNYRVQEGYECFSLYQNGAVDEMYSDSFDGFYYQCFKKRDEKVVDSLKTMVDDPRLVHMDFVTKDKFLHGIRKQAAREQREAEGKLISKDLKCFYREIPRPSAERAEELMDELANKFAEEILKYCMERYEGDPKKAPAIIYVGKDKRLI